MGVGMEMGKPRHEAIIMYNGANKIGMNNVQFEEPGFNQGFLPNEEVKGMAGFLMRKGWAKDEGVANIILIAVTVACLVIAVIVFSLGSGDVEKIKLEDVSRMKHLPQIKK